MLSFAPELHNTPSHFSALAPRLPSPGGDTSYIWNCDHHSSITPNFLFRPVPSIRPAPRRVEFGPRYPSAMMHEHNSSLQLLQYLVFQWSSSPLCAHTDAHRMIPFSWHMFCNVLCILMNAGHLSAKRHTPRLVFPRRP